MKNRKHAVSFALALVLALNLIFVPALAELSDDGSMIVAPESPAEPAGPAEEEAAAAAEEEAAEEAAGGFAVEGFSAEDVAALESLLPSGGASESAPASMPEPTQAPVLPSVELGSSLQFSGGKTTITWEAVGMEPGSYRVYVKPIRNGTADQKQIKVGETSSHSVQTTECLPGKSYEVTLTDGSNNILDQKEYRMDDPETFQDGKLKNTSIKITIKPRRMAAGGEPKDYNKSLKASEIRAGLYEGSYYYGMKYQMRMPQLVKQRSFFVTLAFEAPDGYLYVEQATDITFERVNNGYQTLWWNLAGAKFFLQLYQDTGDIQSGKYTVYLYWDGMWVNTSHFTVS